MLIRELAIQIAEQFEALGSAIGLRCSVVKFDTVVLYLCYNFLILVMLVTL